MSPSRWSSLLCAGIVIAGCAGSLERGAAPTDRGSPTTPPAVVVGEPDAATSIASPTHPHASAAASKTTLESVPAFSSVPDQAALPAGSSEQTRSALCQRGYDDPVSQALCAAAPPQSFAELLQLLGLDKDTPDPKGGSYGRNADGSLPGEHKETALFAVREPGPGFTGKLADDAALNGSSLWASYGQTTAQECGVGPGRDDTGIIRNAIDKQLLPINLYLCARDSSVSDVLAAACARSGKAGRCCRGTDRAFPQGCCL